MALDVGLLPLPHAVLALVSEEGRGLRLSILLGAVLGFGVWRRSVAHGARSRWLAGTGIVAGGAIFGAVTYIGCWVAVAVFSWLETPNQWHVLLLSAVLQGLALWILWSPWREGRRGRVATALDGSRPVTAPPGWEWPMAVGLVGAVAVAFAGGFLLMDPPYRPKMVLLLWLQLPLAAAVIIEVRGGGRSRPLAAYEVFTGAGLAAVLLIASYVGLRLHYGHPLIPF